MLALLPLLLLCATSTRGDVEEFFVSGPNQLHNVATEAYLVSWALRNLYFDSMDCLG